jgi:hypothetical protein
MAASSPMSVGSMSPAMAASTAPRRATSERGQTTAVVIGRKIFAALDELVEDVVVGGMADQWVNGNGFSQRWQDRSWVGVCDWAA